jgi:hypothetical protein
MTTTPPSAQAAADALLDALRVPGQVVRDDQRAELQVDASAAAQASGRIEPSSRKKTISVRISTAREPVRPVSRFISTQRSLCYFRAVICVAEEHYLSEVACTPEKPSGIPAR